jgi:hypothetical protein
MKEKNFKSRYFFYHLEDGAFWFRLFGRGIAIKNSHKHKLLFSQRMGLAGFNIGRYYISYLKKITPLK